MIDTPESGGPIEWGRRSRRNQGERASTPLIAFGVTVAAIIGIGVAIVNSPNWPKVQARFFNGEKFAASFPDVLSGFWLDIKMFVIAQVLILVVALLVIGRAVQQECRDRSLAILLFGFGVPALDLQGVPSSPLFWGVLTLVLSYSAYTAEVYRAGIESVPESQRASATSLGLTQWQALRYAVLPQAIRNVVPALLNGLVSLQKDVALVSVLGVREAVRNAQIYTSRTYNYTSYVVAAVLFLIISVPLARVADWYTARDRRRRSQGYA